MVWQQISLHAVFKTRFFNNIAIKQVILNLGIVNNFTTMICKIRLLIILGICGYPILYRVVLTSPIILDMNIPKILIIVVEEHNLFEGLNAPALV